MSFTFDTEADGDFYRSMTGLVNGNNGFFRSTKQRWFVLNKALAPWGMDPCAVNRGAYPGVTVDDSFKVKEMFGIDIAVGQRLYWVYANMRWAAGRRANRSVEWAFVVDDLGVVRKYKMHRTYTECGNASSINAAKTKLEWSRPSDAVAPAELVEGLAAEKAKASAPIEAGNHVGKVGKRDVFELTVDFVKNLGFKQVAYNVGYESWLVVAHDKDGNVVKMFGGFGEAVKKGEVIKVKATVKDHTYYKGRCETIVNRCKPC